MGVKTSLLRILLALVLLGLGMYAYFRSLPTLEVSASAHAADSC